VKIRVASSNGHPLPKQNVSVGLLDEASEKHPANYDAKLNLETDGNGEVVFRLPEPAPVHFAVDVHLTSEYWHCKCLALVATRDVVQNGIVQAADTQVPTEPTSSKASSGIVLFVVRPFTFVERLIYPFVKGLIGGSLLTAYSVDYSTVQRLVIHKSVRRFKAIERVARRKLDQLHFAVRLSDLAAPPGNRLESLRGDRKGQHSIRINDQWRVCFVWSEGNAYQVEIVDYHG